LLNFDIIAALAAATALAGILRGYSGFGGGLVMAPLFTHLVGATNSVVLISLIHLFTSFQGARRAARQVDLTVVGPLTITAILSVPLGVLLLGWLQPHLIKLVIAAVVVALALTMSFGLRLPGQPTRLKSALVGIISGALNGLCGMGGPPAVLYVLAGNQGSAELRASFILFFAVLYPVTVITLAVNGLITSPTFWVAIPMAPVYFAATEAGRLLFHHVRASWFTPICTAVLCLSGLSMFLS
jgi:uncharacterized membrane protein YfcA